VTASRGKVARAEPVAALYEQSKVRHVRTFTELEDQMAAMTGEGYVGDGSPDRCDALDWALSELMITPEPEYFCHIMVGLGGIFGSRNERPVTDEENFRLATLAFERGELRGSDLTWFLVERQRREQAGIRRQ
jgi:hypothetical protein